MARKKKEFNKNGTFQKRFTDLWYKSGKTQEQLAKALGVTRPTVVGWSDGRNLPDIESLERITKLFGVSADYLLGLSDTVSPDVSLRAAVEYTGLSEAAVEWLHMGLDDFGCDGEGMSEETKNANLGTASALIVSRAFTKMIQNLRDVADEAYFENILRILDTRYSECDLPEEDPNFRYAKKADRDIVVDNLIHVLQMKAPYWKESIPDRVYAMDDNALYADVFKALYSAQEANELHQFHAAKAFSGYLDQLVQESYQKAQQRFEVK